ncbi:MAG: hypothetical protein ACRDPE_09245 [Solirubrobacterales bacterium]
MKGSLVAGLILGVSGLFCIASQIFRDTPYWPVFIIGFLLVLFGALVADDGNQGGRR